MMDTYFFFLVLCNLETFQINQNLVLWIPLPPLSIFSFIDCCFGLYCILLLALLAFGHFGVGGETDDFTVF